MKDIPYKTRHKLDDICSGMPSTPWRGSRAISHFLRTNYSYGADENIRQKKWVRYPHEVNRLLNCHDSGIYSYLLATNLGLDASLIRFEDFRETNQPHLATVVRGRNSDYLISHESADKISFYETHFSIDISDEKINYSKLSFLEIPDIVKMVKESKEKEGFLRFFEKGQTLQDYYISKKTDENLFFFFGVKRSILINKDGFMNRKSFQIPGFYLNLDFEPEHHTLDLSISAGLDNMVLIDKIPIRTYDFKSNKETSYVQDIPLKKKRKLIKPLTHFLSTNYYANELIKQNADYDRFKRHILKNEIKPKTYFEK